MLFSEHFNLELDTEDDWFDAILDADTRIFVDPFLVFQDKQPRWSESHRELIKYFDSCFRLTASGMHNPASTAYQKVLSMLVFTEPREFGLGYTAKGTAGSGTGKAFAKVIVEAMGDAITRGLVNLQHFEELGILSEGIGPDRISDITCNVLKRYFIGYTQEVVGKHGIPTSKHAVSFAVFDGMRQRLIPATVELPTNPHTHGPIILAPKRFLRDLPVLNAKGWWSDNGHDLRPDLNYEVMQQMSKAAIVAEARRNIGAVQRWTQTQESIPARPYDFSIDPKGIWEWDSATRRFASQHPLALNTPKSESELEAFVSAVVSRFQTFVERKESNSLLWIHGGKEKGESSFQLLLRGLVRQYFRVADLDVDQDANIGTDPIVVSSSDALSSKVCLLAKKLRSTRYWGEFPERVAKLARSGVRDIWLMVLQTREDDLSDRRILELVKLFKTMESTYLVSIRWQLLDGCYGHPLPASDGTAGRLIDVPMPESMEVPFEPYVSYLMPGVPAEAIDWDGMTGPQLGDFSAAIQSAFPSPDALRRFMEFSLGKSLYSITSNGPLPSMVFDILTAARAQRWLRRLCVAAVAENPGSPLLAAFAKNAAISRAIGDGQGHVRFESVTGSSALDSAVPGSSPYQDMEGIILSMSTIRAQVCRIEIGGVPRGTGFLIGRSAVLTNWHVIHDEHDNLYGGSSMVLRFDFLRAGDAIIHQGTEFRVESDWLVDTLPASKFERGLGGGALPTLNELDYAVIRVAGEPGSSKAGGRTATPDPPVRGWVRVPPGTPAFSLRSPLIVVQHPLAEPLSAATSTSAIVSVNANRTRVTYAVHTEPGSSGSPCFDKDWSLVALHHSGQAVVRPRYNEGIPIDTIRDRLIARNHWVTIEN